MHNYICTTCGIQYGPFDKEPSFCAVCNDERQYVNPAGQSFTQMHQLNSQHKNVIEQVAPNVFAIYSTPAFAIGQRAHLIITPNGNILWDCISNIDESTTTIINALGGIQAIAISHPHFFSAIAAWSNAFNQAPVYINSNDEQWLGTRPSNLQMWQDELLLWSDNRLVQCGGHFPGSSVLYLPSNGCLFTGDTIQVCPDRKTVSFMYSYPNMIPLTSEALSKIEHAVADLAYDSIYGAFGHYIITGARHAVAYSMQRYRKIYCHSTNIS